MSFYTEFELDLLAALRQHLPPVIDKLQQEQLTTQAISVLPLTVQGVYLLYLDNMLVYVGKTDAEKGLRARLTRHFNTLSARENIDISRVTFKAVRIAVFTVLDIESVLIKHYLGGEGAPAWQYSGFGSNDPGRYRDDQKPSDFDLQYPVKLDFPVITDSLSSPDVPASTIVAEVKEQLPFLFRYGRKPNEKAELEQALCTLPPGSLPLSSVLQTLIAALPAGWQATVLPGRVLLYKEARDYSNARPQLILPT